MCSFVFAVGMKVLKRVLNCIISGFKKEPGCEAEKDIQTSVT